MAEPKAKSKYYKEKEKQEKAKLHALQKEVPRFMKAYLTDVELSREPRTAIAYTRDLLTFARFLQESNPLYRDTPVTDIPYECIESLTFADINEFQQYLSQNDGLYQHNNGDEAIARAMCAVRGFFHFEVSHDNLAKDPTIGAAKDKRKKTRPIERLSVPEARDLLDGIEASLSGTDRSRAFTVKTQLRDTAIVTLLLNTGIRISECVGLDIADLDLEHRSIRILRKGGNEADIYFNQETADALRDYITIERPGYIRSDDEEALFLSGRKKRMAVRSMQEMLEKYGRAILGYTNLHPHLLRKTYGTALYEETSDIALVSDTLGHRSIETTRKHYSDVSDEHKRRNLDIHLFSEPQ